jgi:serine/threonine protein kinase
MKTQRFAGEQPPLMDTPRNPTDPLLPGTEVLGGRYVVVRTLGKGGMGVVVAARHKGLGRLDAIKFLLPELVTHSDILARFEREAISVAKLTSPHVARVYDSNFADADEPYIVMEYLEGRDLKSVLRVGPLLIEDGVDYLLQICHALAEAHENGIVHRDLKPANLFLTFPKNGSPLVKVLDFGIAKLMDTEAVTDITVEDGKGGFLGTIPYMSPEHLRGAKKVDKRTDIWAMGVIAYELFTCKKPFNGLTRLDLMSKILDKDEHPDPPSKYRRELPPAIEMVIGRCLAKNRDDRYETIQEFEAALREAAGIPAAPPMRPRMASISMESPIDLPPINDEKTREFTHGKTQAGFTATNPVPSIRSKRVKVALAGSGALATSAAIVGLVLALYRGENTEQAAVGASPVPAASAATSAMPLVVPEPSASAAPAVEPGEIEIEEAETAKTATIGATSGKTAERTPTNPGPMKNSAPAPQGPPPETSAGSGPKPAPATKAPETKAAPSDSPTDLSANPWE